MSVVVWAELGEHYLQLSMKTWLCRPNAPPGISKSGGTISLIPLKFLALPDLAMNDAARSGWNSSNSISSNHRGPHWRATGFMPFWMLFLRALLIQSQRPDGP